MNIIRLSAVLARPASSLPKPSLSTVNASTLTDAPSPYSPHHSQLPGTRSTIAASTSVFSANPAANRCRAWMPCRASRVANIPSSR